MKKIILFLSFSVFAFSLFAQPDVDEALAAQYFNQGEYQQAAELYSKLYKDNANQEVYSYYLKCLIALKEFKDARKLIQKHKRKNPMNLALHVDLGQVFELMGESKKAEDEYEEAIENLLPNRIMVIQLANALIKINRPKLSLQAYERGSELLGDKFYLEKGAIFRALKDYPKYINNVLAQIQYSPEFYTEIREGLQDDFGDEKMVKELLTQLYAYVQNEFSSLLYTDLLIWTLVQKKDFNEAFIQSRAVDKRLRENGKRVYDLAGLLVQEKEYQKAIQSFEYVIKLGNEPGKRYYNMARQDLLNTRLKLIEEAIQPDSTDVFKLIEEYHKYIEEYSNVRQRVADGKRKLAKIYAYYLHNLDTAIAYMQTAMDIRHVGRIFVNEAKLELGDYYLMNREIWEATLLYSQVDKEMKDAPLGELARYKNALWQYYQGEFNLAQDQLNILKGATSELISNDAIQLSVFISDHLDLDTTAIPMELFAKADLLLFQNKVDSAELLFDKLEVNYKGHGLLDNVLMKRADIALKRQNPDKAMMYYQKILDEFSYDLLADDALFKLAVMYQDVKKDNTKAQELFQKLLLEHKGSLYTVEARERFRKLRGDKIN